MTRYLPLIAGVMALAALGSSPTQAQTLDASFVPNTMYAPATVYSSLEQADGKQVVVGNINRVDGTPTAPLVRFNTNGTTDAAFQQNLGSVAAVFRTSLLSNGQLMLIAFGNVPLTANGISRVGLLRLNSDGTADASLNVGTGPTIGGAAGTGYIDDVLQLPNGQLLVVGYFDQFNGVAANNIIRLSATGAVDATFNAGQGANTEIEAAVRLASGKFLVGGYYTAYNGTTRGGLTQLNADGSLDATFNTLLQPNSEVSNLVVQPDGKILILGYLMLSSTPTPAGLLRLNADGTVDNTFTQPASINPISSYYGNALQLQPDGKIVLLSQQSTTFALGVSRLNSNGTLDTSFQPTATPNNFPYSLTLLSSGKTVLAGGFTNVGGLLDRGLIQYTSTGALDASFQPKLQSTGSISALVQQADGKLVAGGNFSEINGQSVRRLARFNTNGTVDGTFATNPGIEGVVNDLALQPDGRILAAGPSFLRRFSTTGTPDNTFTVSIATSLMRILLQPDGRVLVGSNYIYSNGVLVSNGLVRLLADGSRDNSFAPNTTGAGRFTSFGGFGLQPNGKILVAGNYISAGANSSTRTVMRLEATGAVDATFTGSTLAGGSSGIFSNFDFQPDGKILMGGSFNTYGGVARTSVARLNADGTLDAGFTPPTLAGTVNKVKLQPNGRVLLGGNFNSTAVPSYLARLLATGAADASYAATAVPSASVTSLLIQPDGKIVAGGSFTTVGGQAIQGLARITAANVLQVAAPAAVATRTEAWPVPAHTTLTVAPDASAHPQAVELLDLLGRPVLRQALAGAAPAQLAVENLRAGTYVLRVTYAEGMVTRRVQVQ